MSALSSNVLRAVGVGSICAVGGFIIVSTTTFLLHTHFSETLSDAGFVFCGRSIIFGTIAVIAYTAGYYFGPNKARGMIASVIAAFLLMLVMTSTASSLLTVGKLLTVAIVIGLLAGLAASWRAGGEPHFRRIFALGLTVVLLWGVGFYTWAILILLPINRQLSTHNRLLNVSVACSQYMMEEGDSPGSITDLFKSAGKRNVYLEPWAANDGWGHPIEIRMFNASLGHGSVISYGRDGRAGGDGPDADTAVPFAAITR